MFGIHKADWHGHGAFANKMQEKRAYDILYQKNLEANLAKQGNRCPRCKKTVKWYRKKDKIWVCGRCDWEGKNVVRPEKVPGPNTESNY